MFAGLAFVASISSLRFRFESFYAKLRVYTKEHPFSWEVRGSMSRR